MEKLLSLLTIVIFIAFYFVLEHINHVFATTESTLRKDRKTATITIIRAVKSIILITLF